MNPNTESKLRDLVADKVCAAVGPLSLTQVSKLTGVHVTALSRYCAGQRTPPLLTVFKLADGLGLDPRQFVPTTAEIREALGLGVDS